MATQGIVSIADKNGKTLTKVVAGSDGYNAPKLVEAILERKIRDRDSVMRLAMECGFGGGGLLRTSRRVTPFLPPGGRVSKLALESSPFGHLLVFRVIQAPPGAPEIRGPRTW